MWRTVVAVSCLASSACLQTGDARKGPPDAANPTPDAANPNPPACIPDCGDDAICLDGGCVDLCALVGQTRCDAGCADLIADDGNCGVCGRACPLGEPCRQGVCNPIVCPSGLTPCGDAGDCVDLSTDDNNCGTCGMACASGAVCTDGMCPPFSCPSGLAICGNRDAGLFCVAPQVDPDNCGACGVVCGPGTSCRGAMCTCDPPTDPCFSATPDAGMICVDTATDPTNCGGCGIGCVACETCVLGACVPTPEISQGVVIEQRVTDGGYFDAESIAVADINGDGLPDILFAGTDSDYSTEYTNASVGWILALPDGGHGAPVYSAIPNLPDGDEFPGSVIESADFNGDGIADIAVLFSGGFEVGGVLLEVLTGVALGDPAVAFSWQDETLSTFSSGVGLAVGDLNGDGLADVIVAAGDPTQLMIFVSTGDDGGFLPPVTIDLDGGVLVNAYATTPLGIADMNQDGLADIVIPDGVFLQYSDGGLGPLVPVIDPAGVSHDDLAPYPGPAPAFLETAYNQLALLASSPAGPRIEASSALLFPVPYFYSPCAIDLNLDGLSDAVLLTETEGYFEVCLRRGSSFDCNSTASANLGGVIAAWQTDGGAQAASAGYYITLFQLTCPVKP